MPRVKTGPHAKSNDFEDASFLAAAYGLPPDEWQEGVLESWLGVRFDGKWAASRCGLAVPRQNGKNAVLEMRELFGMVNNGERFLHTAHEVKTARKAFMRLTSFFENPRAYPELANLVRAVRRTNGQEAILLTNGGSVEFVARSKSSGRGFSVDCLVMDEAQELSEESLEALLPTISVSPNPQTIMTGTPPGPLADGEVFTRTRETGCGATDRRLSWMEWSCSGEVDLDDRENWSKVNPALGSRLSWETVADEREAFSDEGFARERLGMWADELHRGVIDMDAWQALADDASVIADELVMAIDVPPDRSRVFIALCGPRADGIPSVEVVPPEEAGTAWAVEWLAGRVAKWRPQAVLLDSGGPAGALIAPLAEVGVEVAPTGAQEMKRACGAFFDAVVEGKLRHLGQPGLDEAVAGARKRDLHDAWVWTRRGSSCDITPLRAATLAVYGWHARGSLTKVTKPSKAFAF